MQNNARNRVGAHYVEGMNALWMGKDSTQDECGKWMVVLGTE